MNSRKWEMILKYAKPERPLRPHRFELDGEPPRRYHPVEMGDSDLGGSTMLFMRASRRVIVALAVALTGLVFIPASCSKKGGEADWKAKIETVNGVRTVSNPETPRYGTFAFDLVEDLAIGDEKNEDYFFPGGATVSIDDHGAFYVCDYGNRRVQVYGRDGKFVRTLGRVGQGPGEYAFPSSVLIDGSGNIEINDGRSLIVYGRDGLYQKKIPLKTFLGSLILGPGGTIVGTTQPNPRAKGGTKNELVQLGPDGEPLRTIAEFAAYGVVNDLVINHWYTPRISFCRRAHDSLYYGFSLDYMIHVVDGDGRPRLAFSKSEKAGAITGEEKGLTRKEGIFSWSGRGDPETTDLGMPDHRPFFSRFFSDEAGRLYVVRFRPITEREVGTQDIDVFSKDGFYLYRMTWPFMPQVIRGGFLYEVRQDEDKGLTRIIRYRITNWSDFKAE